MAACRPIASSGENAGNGSTCRQEIAYLQVLLARCLALPQEPAAPFLVLRGAPLGGARASVLCHRSSRSTQASFEFQFRRGPRHGNFKPLLTLGGMIHP